MSPEALLIPAEEDVEEPREERGEQEAVIAEDQQGGCHHLELCQ